MVKVKEAIDYIHYLVTTGGIDVDGYWGKQCVDLSNAIPSKFFNTRLAGNAIDLLNSAKAKGWTVVYDAPGVNPKAGAIFVTKEAHQYGHTGVVIEDSDGVTIKTVEQNIDGYRDNNRDGIDDSLQVGGPAKYFSRGFSNVVGWFYPPYEDLNLNGGSKVMVKKINRQMLTAAGPMNEIRGVVIHNDAGSMTAEQYVNWLETRNKALGIAHYYITKDCIARVVDTNLVAWHTGHPTGNGHYIGYEVCQSTSASDKDFLANEDMTLMQAAEDLLFYGLPINEQSVKLHHEFVPTTCPHRSMKLHGGSTASTKSYFIERMKYFATLGTTVEEMMAGGKKPAGSGQPRKSDEEVAQEVLNGVWGNGKARVDNLTAAGYDAKKVQAIVDVIKQKPAAKKSEREVANLVMMGRYGNGKERIAKLTAEGYDHRRIQAIVDDIKKKM